MGLPADVHSYAILPIGYPVGGSARFAAARWRAWVSGSLGRGLQERLNDPSWPAERIDAAWFNPVEAAVRDRVRGFIEELLDEGLDAALGRSRYRRSVSAEEAGGSGGYRYGRRNRVRLDRKCGLMRCTVHVHRNLSAPASERLHEEVPADYNDMVYTVTPKEIEHAAGESRDAVVRCCSPR